MLTTIPALMILVAAAQPPSAPPDALRQLDAMVGEWEGSGWIEQGARETFTGKETVSRKAGGHALLIEGRHFAADAGGGEPALIHDALALIWYDRDQKQLRMHAQTARGDQTQTELKVDGVQMQWGFQRGPAHVRFNIRIEDGHWKEEGEFSADGTQWRKFMEMNLKRVTPTP